MSKDKVKNLIKLIIVCAVAVVVTVLAVVFVLQDNAYAWFAKNTVVTADGMEVGLKINESIVDGTTPLEYYKYSSEDSEDYLAFKKDKVYVMDTYSSLKNNVYQFIVKINLTDVDSVTVFANTVAESYLGADDADKLEVSGNSLSSVVAFEVYYSNGTEVDAKTTDMLKLTPPETLTEYSFVNNDKTLSSSVQLGDTYKFTGDEKSVYIVIKYNVNAINEVISHNIGNDVFNGDTDIAFSCDFSFSVV